MESQMFRRCLGLGQGALKLSTVLKIIPRKVVGVGLSNLLLMLLLDSLIGLIFSYQLLQFPNLYLLLHSKVEDLLKVLLQLLNWLRGSPAGLKLNSALNSLLWRFFSYHLHLWANYIGILEPILSAMLSVVILAGPAGFSVQLALMRDLLSIATFHVYCLYIYATRLFHVQVNAIISLGRLFTGRKWNPLRNRVDHVQLSKSEMFLSAMTFTIGVFLAPTTIIYYVVFLLVMLRLPVFLIELSLTSLVNCINTMELGTSILVLLNSPLVADEVYLHPVLIKGSAPGIRIQLKFETRLQTTLKVFTLPEITKPTVHVLKCVCQGRVLNFEGFTSYSSSS